MGLVHLKGSYVCGWFGWIKELAPLCCYLPKHGEQWMQMNISHVYITIYTHDTTRDSYCRMDSSKTRTWAQLLMGREKRTQISWVQFCTDNCVIGCPLKVPPLEA